MAETYKVVRDGTEFFVNSLEEAAELHRALSARQTTAGRRAVPVGKRGHLPPVTANLNAKLDDAMLQGAVGSGFDVKRATVEFLQSIKNAGPRGALAERIARVLHAEHPKGIGGRMGPVKKYLAALGFPNTEELFDNPKLPTGGRIWKAKPKLDAALDAANKALRGSGVPQ